MMYCVFCVLYEPPRGKTNNLVFEKGPTQIELHEHRRMLDA